MKKTKLVGLVVLGVSLGLGGTSVLAKGHDQGVADGTRGFVKDPDSGELWKTNEFSREGAVAARVAAVVGDPGQTYGDIASAAGPANRVIPLKAPRGGPIKKR